MQYKIAELFYSIKGEGYWTGTPMAFIRLSGCNLNCKFCDTDHSNNLQLDELEIVERILSWPTRRVVITGGEPLIHDLVPLLELLKTYRYKIHLETNGTIKRNLYELFDWVAVCPKSLNVVEELYRFNDVINEIKILYGSKDWEDMANLTKLIASNKLIMPLAQPLEFRKEGRDEGLIALNIQKAIIYVLENPEFNFCPQLHKLCGFR